MNLATNLTAKKPSISLRELFAKNVRLARIHVGLSQERLADACGLDRTFIGTLERGIRNISIDNIELIANALELSAAELLSATLAEEKGFAVNLNRVPRTERLYPIGRRKSTP